MAKISYFALYRFAALACVTFYFWLAFLAINTFYCFGFLAHEGPCKFKPGVTNLPQPSPGTAATTTTSPPRVTQGVPVQPPIVVTATEPDPHKSFKPAVEVTSTEGRLSTAPTFTIPTTEATTLDYAPPMIPAYDQVLPSGRDSNQQPFYDLLTQPWCSEVLQCWFLRRPSRRV